MNPEIFSITNIIVGFTCLVSVMAWNNQGTIEKLIFHPVTVKQQGDWFRFLSSGFIHANSTHLLVNMFVLWSFGRVVEGVYYPAFLEGSSATLYLALYFGGVMVSSLPAYFKHQDNTHYRALGASGGVSAVVFAVILFAPWENLYLFAIIPLPQILAGIAYLVYSWIKDKQATDNIGHMAHFTGALWGLIFTILMNFELLDRFINLTLAGPR